MQVQGRVLTVHKDETIICRKDRQNPESNH